MKQSERSQVMRTRLVKVARKLFGAKGYDATSMDELVAAAGATKGAFYHHFTDKKDVFRAVFGEVEREVMESVIANAVGETDSERFRAGCRAYLRACTSRSNQRIVLHDGPKVLGWDDWREIESRYTVEIIELGLKQALGQGSGRSTNVLAHILIGGLCEAGIIIAHAKNPKAVLEEVTREVDEFVAALLTTERYTTTLAVPTAAPAERAEHEAQRTSSTS